MVSVPSTRFVLPRVIYILWIGAGTESLTKLYLILCKKQFTILCLFRLHSCFFIVLNEALLSSYCGVHNAYQKLSSEALTMDGVWRWESVASFAFGERCALGLAISCSCVSGRTDAVRERERGDWGN